MQLTITAHTLKAAVKALGKAVDEPFSLQALKDSAVFRSIQINETKE